MTSASRAHPDDRRRRVSIRTSAATSSTETASAANAALQHVLDRRLRKREGRLPPPAARALGSTREAVAGSIDRFGLPQWLFRAAVLGFVTFVLGFAVFAAMPGKGGRQGVAVEGRVLFNGRPLAQAALEFHGAGANGPITVLIDTNETGAFRRPVSAGLPAGTYTVVVKSGCVMPNPQAERGTPVKIPAKYKSVDSTPLKVTVAEAAAPFEFALR